MLSVFPVFKSEKSVHDWSKLHNIPVGDVRQIKNVWGFAKEWHGGHVNRDWRKWNVVWPHWRHLVYRGYRGQILIEHVENSHCKDKAVEGTTWPPSQWKSCSNFISSLLLFAMILTTQNFPFKSNHAV